MGGLPLFETVVFIALLGLLIPIGLSNTVKWRNSTQQLGDARKLESALYLSQIKARATLTDQWITAPSFELKRDRLDFKSAIIINGSGRLGYASSGATKYAGTATVGTQYRVTVGVGYAKPSIQKQP